MGKWVGPGGKSGEIDMVELCPNTHVYSNFAGAQEPEGLQVRWPNADPNNFDGHVSMWVEPGSKPQVKVKMCSAEQAANNAGSCHKANAAFYSDIFGSHACADGDCEYILFLTSGMVLVVMPVSTHAHSIEGQATQTVASLSGISKYEAHPLKVNVLH